MKEIVKRGDFEWQREVVFKENKDGKFNITFTRPNIFKRVLIWAGFMKDKRHIGKMTWQELDEMGVMGDTRTPKKWTIDPKRRRSGHPYNNL